MEEIIKDISKRLYSAMNCSWMDPIEKERLITSYWAEVAAAGIPPIKVQCYMNWNEKDIAQEIKADEDKRRRELQDEVDRIQRKQGRKL